MDDAAQRLPPALLMADCEGAAYGRSFRALALLIALGLCVMAYRVHLQSATVLATTPVKTAAWGDGLSLLGLFIVLGITSSLWLSRSGCRAGVIFQTGLWRKQLACAEVGYATILHVPYLDWLVAPRLYVRSLAGKPYFFYVADADVRREMQQFCEHKKNQRTEALVS